MYNYPLYGHSIDLPTNDQYGWIKTVYKLTMNNWVDSGSRVMFVTLNFVNMNISTISVIVLCIEISPSGNLIPSLEIRSVDCSIFDPVSISLQVLIEIVILVQWVVLGRDLFRSVEEIDYEAVKSLPNKVAQFRNPRDMLKSWEEYDNQSFYKRIRLPYLGEVVMMFLFLMISVVQLAKLSWYHSTLKPAIDFDNSSYVDLFPITEDYAWIVNIDCFITLLLGISMVQHTLIWIHDISIFSTMLSIALREIGWFIIACIIGFIGFVVLFYQLIGPFEYVYSSLDRAILSVFCTFLGSWKSSNSFEEYIGVWAVVFGIGLLMVAKTAMYMSSVLNMQWQLMEARNIGFPKHKYRSLRKKQKESAEDVNIIPNVDS